MIRNVIDLELTVDAVTDAPPSNLCTAAMLRRYPTEELRATRCLARDAGFVPGPARRARDSSAGNRNKSARQVLTLQSGR
jgi:hypothetical protein